MTWRPDYATTAELKAQVGIPLADTQDDANLGLCITTASRAIDQCCNRQFGSEASPVARYYTYDARVRVGNLIALAIDDLMTTSGLLVATDFAQDHTYSSSLVYSTNFDLWPWNAPADGMPYTHLVLRSGTAVVSSLLPYWEGAVRVTAQWGWTSVPSAIKEATLIQAARFFKRKDAPFGVAGSPEMGSELRLLQKLDPDVAVMVSPYRRRWGAV